MGIDLKEIMKGMELSDDQMKLMEEAQTSVNTAFSTDLESQKAGVLNKNKELIDKLKAAKDNAIPDNFDMDGYTDYMSNRDKIATEQRQMEEDKLVASENWNKLKNDMLNTHETVVKKLNKDNSGKVKDLRNALDSELIENVALKEIEKVQGSQILLMPHIKNNINTYQDENGRYQTKVVDLNGKDRMNNETGEQMTVGELVAEFQANDQFSGAFPTRNRGSNTIVTTGGRQYNSTNNPFDKKGNNYSLTEQAILNKTNPTLAKTLREAVYGS